MRRLPRAVHRDHGVGPPVQRRLQHVRPDVAAAPEHDDLVVWWVGGGRGGEGRLVLLGWMDGWMDLN